MRILSLYAAVIAVCLMLLQGCTKEEKLNQSPNSSQSKSTNGLRKTGTAADVSARLASLRSSLSLPEHNLNTHVSNLLQQHPEYKSVVLQALKAPGAPVCNSNTPIRQWLNEQLSDWDENTIFFASITGMLDFPTYDALLFENSEAGQTFGINGEYTHVLTKTFKDLKRFWDIQSADIIMVAMHGNMLLDRDRIIRIDMILYGDSQTDAEFWADLIISLMNDVPQYRKGDHPIFTFNAFAQSSFDFPPYGTIPSKIVMGDGILDGYTGIGYGDVAPQAVLAHEFGHHIQFQLNLYPSTSSPENTRKMELMADAFSAYYLSHARGASMQWKRVKQFLQVFFNIGDCGFTNVNHHGTPTQRMASAEWAYQVADNAQKQGHILSSSEFVSLFLAAYPSILAH
ncbi:hypothetical protein QTN47_17655 [Danxiaibacter flavus]|uniref:Uncharacterized protein n=1 Tax=Danxiaibacter flavus TaxID=3049108 RepID=A0ABV3ZJL0_9BACT|nr:hypothetical protein QNM32_17665 [Chitinophagaceae bacterium DXS]